MKSLRPLSLAVVMVGFALTVLPSPVRADQVTIANQTGQKIMVCVYKGTDKVMTVALKCWTINANETAEWERGKDSSAFKVKVFKPGVIDKLWFSKAKVSNAARLNITNKGVTPVAAAKAAPAPTTPAPTAPAPGAPSPAPPIVIAWDECKKAVDDGEDPYEICNICGKNDTTYPCYHPPDVDADSGLMKYGFHTGRGLAPKFSHSVALAWGKERYSVDRCSLAHDKKYWAYTSLVRDIEKGCSNNLNAYRCMERVSPRALDLIEIQARENVLWARGGAGDLSWKDLTNCAHKDYRFTELPPKGSPIKNAAALPKGTGNYRVNMPAVKDTTLTCPGQGQGGFYDPRNGGECWKCPSGHTVRTGQPVTSPRACGTTLFSGFKHAIFLGPHQYKCPPGYKFNPFTWRKGVLPIGATTGFEKIKGPYDASKDDNYCMDKRL